MARLPDIGWWENFKGRCIACKNAVPSPRSKEMICQLMQAMNCGLGSRPGGAYNGHQVHKLFGCVFFESAQPPDSKAVNEKKT